ncbi:MAG: aminomethyl transferase family protein [Gammaproteobacteria bacterium]|nr:aminomethyl transferase family protein [Gammaproteobacteria bacterium]
MTNAIKKSVLCDLVSRHSDFDFASYIANNTADDYDIWNDYCLPMFYSDAKKEYQAIRNGCAIFDASPMKKYRLRGADAGQFLDRIMTSPMSQMPLMRSSYGLICNEQGLMVDDGIVFRITDNEYLLLITEIEHDDHFSKYNDFADLTITEETASLAGLAVQGPKSCAVLKQFGFSGIENLKPFELTYFELDGHQVLTGRVGFTGDLGYEIWFSPDAIEAVEKALNNADEALGLQIPGYGLTAVQICRIEAGMIVPGWDTAGEFTDLENERTPYELTLGWNVKLDREEEFVGKAALTQQKLTGPRFRMKGITINHACSVEEGQELYANINGERITVGTLPSLIWNADKSQWIGFVSLKINHADVNNTYIKENDTEIDCQICKLPFINLQHRVQVPAMS